MNFKRLREGNYYKIRNGTVLGPMERESEGKWKGKMNYPKVGWGFYNDFGIYSQGYMPWLDLIEEVELSDKAPKIISSED